MHEVGVHWFYLASNVSISVAANVQDKMSQMHLKWVRSVNTFKIDEADPSFLLGFVYLYRPQFTG